MVDQMVEESTASGSSLTLLSLYYVTYAANQVEAFRLRLEERRVVLYDKIYAGSTILHDDETFGFAYFSYPEDKKVFLRGGREAIEKQKREKSFSPRSEDNGLIHCSILPWVKFTSFQHARLSTSDHSIPKIVLGMIYNKDGHWWMPVSVEVHHALVDGLHVGRYFEKLEQLCNRKD